MTRLSVNVNKIALVRNSRVGKGPDVVRLSRLALDAGAAGITVHPRPDRRHVTPADVDALAALVADYPGREFNIEGNPFEGDWMEIVLATRPHQATLVPDAPGQATSDHGFDVPAETARLVAPVAKLREAGCRVSVFMDPISAAMRHVPATGAERIELYTESFAVAHARRDADPAGYDRTLAAFADAARAARDAGLGVNAGHDLNLSNLGDFVAAVGRDTVEEVSIGHALIGDALEHGMAGAVERYLAALA